MGRLPCKNRHYKILHTSESAGRSPIHVTTYITPLRQRQVEKNKASQMLKVGAADPATTEWASLIVLVWKKNPSLRFYVEYHRLDIRKVKKSTKFEVCINTQIFPENLKCF